MTKKIPPYSIQAEQSLLGGLILNNTSWDSVSEHIIINDFYSYPHKVLFKEIQILLDQGIPVDFITLSEILQNKNLLDITGGMSYLGTLTQITPSIANIRSYADIIRDKAVVRDLILIANKIADAGYHPNGRSSNELLDYAEANVFKITQSRIIRNNEPKNINQMLKKTIKEITSLYNNPNQNGITGLNTGYQDLNNKTYGLQNSDLIIIAARPSMGKTTFAMNLCENIAMLYSKPVLIFSLEMPAKQIMLKLVSSLSRVDQTKLRTGLLNHNEWLKIQTTFNILEQKNNIFIDDCSSLNPTELRSKARRIYQENKGLSLIMIDYLQLMKNTSTQDNRTLEIAEISRSLKSLAKELNVPIIALSQLNRYLEQRADKRPINSDLRESGAIEQDADLIMFIYRDEVYNTNSKMKGIAELIIGKHRNGPIGKILLTFNAKYSRFDNYGYLHPSYNNFKYS